MLHLYIGDKKEYYLSGDKVFDYKFDKSKLMEDFSKEVIRTIDKSEVVSEHLIISPVLGAIPPSYLSGGSKTLIMLMYADFKFYIEAMGDNCFPLLKRICDKKEIYMCSTCYRPLFEYGFDKVHILNEDKIVTNSKDYLDIEIKYGGEMLDEGDDADDEDDEDYEDVEEYEDDEDEED